MTNELFKHFPPLIIENFIIIDNSFNSIKNTTVRSLEVSSLLCDNIILIHNI